MSELLSVNTYIQLIERWHEDRNLIDGSTDKDQYMKLVQEVGELSESICEGKDIKDDIGDIFVVLINLCKRNEVSFSECVAKAYDDIKDRKGRMFQGVFIKESE